MMYFLFENQTFNGLLKVIGIHKDFDNTAISLRIDNFDHRLKI